MCKSFSQMGNRHQNISHLICCLTTVGGVFVLWHCDMDSCLQMQALIAFHINKIRSYAEPETILFLFFLTKALAFPYIAF